MVVLLTILGTIFLIVTIVFILGTQKLDKVNIIVITIATILMTLCYVGSIFAQYMIEFMKQNN